MSDTYREFEVYPMPMFVTLPAEDPQQLADWYVAALGFGVMFAGPVIHLRRQKYQDILIVRGAASPGGPTISIMADGEVDTLAERVRGVPVSGRVVVEGPVDTPWNTRDLRVTDPAGYRLVVTQRGNDPVAEARMRAMFDAKK